MLAAASAYLGSGPAIWKCAWFGHAAGAPGQLPVEVPTELQRQQIAGKPHAIAQP
jgi:hypothetical protein